MAKYRDAFKEGMEAAQKSALSKNEIEQVLKDLKSEILDLTEGQILLTIHKLDEPRSYFDTFATFSALSGSTSARKTYQALTAENPKSKNPTITELAVWKTSKMGYPCTLSWDKEEK